MYLVTKYLSILLVYLKTLCSAFSTSWVQQKRGECRRQRIRMHYMSYPYSYFSPNYPGRKRFAINSCWAKNHYLLCINKITLECMRSLCETIDIALNPPSAISKQNIHKQCLISFFVNCCLLYTPYSNYQKYHATIPRCRGWEIEDFQGTRIETQAC